MSMHSGVSSGSGGGMIMQGGGGVVSPETSEREKSAGIANKFVNVSFKINCMLIDKNIILVSIRHYNIVAKILKCIFSYLIQMLY